MSDNRMKDRVKVLLNGTTPESETSEHALVAPPQAHPNQALQVLTLAQRTAEEHVARAHHQADKIRTDALAAAEQVARDSHARTEEARRMAEKIVADARGASEQIGMDAQANADHLNLQARQRYDDVVGSLGTKREALQQQIEALEQFDREYRSRLQTFMQGQLRALWVDQPQVSGELADATEPAPHQPASSEQPASSQQPASPRPAPAQLGAVEGPAEAPAPAGPRHGADTSADTVPTQRHSPEQANDKDERADK